MDPPFMAQGPSGLVVCGLASGLNNGAFESKPCLRTASAASGLNPASGTCSSWDGRVACVAGPFGAAVSVDLFTFGADFPPLLLWLAPGVPSREPAVERCWLAPFESLPRRPLRALFEGIW
jgi:hypothetical protein